MTGTNPADIGADRLGAVGDDFYEALVKAHEGLPEAESTALNARLVLVLANLVGDPALLRAAIEAASRKA